MAEGTESQDGLWAVVTASSGRRYFGQVTEVNDEEACCNDVSTKSFENVRVVNVFPAYEILTSTQSVRTPDGRVGINRETMLFPLDQCVHDAPIVLYAPSEIMDISQLHMDDQRTYTQMLENVQKQMVAARVQKSGLVLPGQEGQPNGRA